jgi:hypothetical protein
MRFCGKLSGPLVAALIAVGLQGAVAGPAVAKKAKPFALLKVSPEHIIAKVTGGSGYGEPKKPWKVKWSGTPTFPITVNITPEPGHCPTDTTLHCSPGTDTIASSDGDSAELAAADWGCSVSGGPPFTFSGIFEVSLTDGDNETSNSVLVEWTCDW